MMRRVQIIPLLLLALVSSACSKETGQPAAEKPKYQEEPTGKALFNERCSQCHMVNGEGGPPVGPDLSQVGAKRDRVFLEQVIREPSKVYPGTVMPPYDTFSKRQVDSLVDYLGTLR